MLTGLTLRTRPQARNTPTRRCARGEESQANGFDREASLLRWQGARRREAGYDA
jgi:hypothetical protein